MRAGGFDVVDGGKGEEGAEEFEPGAAFAEEDDAESGGGNGEEIGKSGELRGFEITESPEIEDVGNGGTEEGHVHHADPHGPRDGAPMGEGAEEDGAMDGERKNDESAEEGVEGVHGEGVVTGGDAFSQNDVNRETERAGEGDGIAEKRRGMAADARTGGHEEYSGEGDEHAEDFA